MKNTIISVVRRNLSASLEMVNRIIKFAPSALWSGQGPTRSIANRVMHMIESVDYHLSVSQPYLYPEYSDKGRPQLQDSLQPFFSREVLREYFLRVANKALMALDSLDDLSILDNNLQHPGRPHLDVFISQIRHVQVNIGYCNEYLVASGAKSEEWIGSVVLPENHVIS